MLGKSPLSSVSISGGSFKLIAVPLTLAASASFLTFGGNSDAGFYRSLSANGVAITFGGSAPGVWLQNLAAVGNAIEFGGLPRLLLAGKPFKFKMIAQPYIFRATRDSYDFKMIARPYKFRGYR